MKRSALVALLLLVGSTRFQGQSSAGLGSFTPHALADTFLQTVSLAASARDLLGETSSSTGSPIADSLNAIVSQRGAANRIRQAVGLLSPFRKAQDDSVREAAENLSKVYETLAERLLAGVVIWEKLAKTKTADDVAALVPEAGQNASDIQEAWRLLPVGAAALSHALVDPQRLIDGKVARLRLTRAQYAQLNADLKRLFPEVNPDQKGGQVVDVTVNLFRSFLSQPWKSSDEP